MRIADLISEELVLQQQYLGSLCRTLVKQVSEEELRALCSDLAINYDDLSSGGRAGKARELVKCLDHDGQIPRLAEAFQQLRPSFSLDITSESEQKLPQPSPVESQADEESSQPPFASPTEGEQPDEPLTFRQKAKRTGYETARRLCRWALTANQRDRGRRNLIPLWRRRHGEPVWLDVPAGEFWMGRGEKEQDNGPAHRVYLGRFQISKVPITVAQYRLFVEATGYPTPFDWVDGLPQRYWRNYPAVYVSWHDALAYCKWLSEVTGKSIILPSEAQWEKAARGHLDCRVYPWGDEWNRAKCNTHEFGRDDAMPVGILRNGASPYGCLDMAGQVWEWTTSLWGKAWSGPEYGYPYDLTDGRENPEASSDVLRVVRGGSFVGDKNQACCTHRAAAVSDFRDFTVGFRAVNVPVS